MEVTLGAAGTVQSWQEDFKPTVTCDCCGGTARLAFVAYELGNDDQNVCDLYDNDCADDKFWPHDCIAVAVYFCGKCCKPCVDWNQA